MNENHYFIINIGLSRRYYYYYYFSSTLHCTTLTEVQHAVQHLQAEQALFTNSLIRVFGRACAYAYAYDVTPRRHHQSASALLILSATGAQGGI